MAQKVERHKLIDIETDRNCLQLTVHCIECSKAVCVLMSLGRLAAN